MNPPLVTVIAATLYFTAGVFREALCVAYYLAVSTKRPLRSSGLAGGIELFDVLVLAAIFKSGWNLILILAYTLGVIVGTYGATKLSK